MSPEPPSRSLPTQYQGVTGELENCVSMDSHQMQLSSVILPEMSCHLLETLHRIQQGHLHQDFHFTRPAEDINPGFCTDNWFGLRINSIRVVPFHVRLSTDRDGAHRHVPKNNPGNPMSTLAALQPEVSGAFEPDLVGRWGENVFAIILTTHGTSLLCR